MMGEAVRINWNIFTYLLIFYFNFLGYDIFSFG